MSEFAKQHAEALASRKGIIIDIFESVVCFSDGTIFCNTTDELVESYSAENKVELIWLKKPSDLPKKPAKK